MDGRDGLDAAARHLDDLLNIPRQVWLLGAGISKDAGIPLMHPLSRRVESLLQGDEKCFGTATTTRSAEIYREIKGQLCDNSHVEHVLSHLGDLISIAERTKKSTVDVNGKTMSAKELRDAHRQIQLAIRYTVEYGYVPADDAQEERIGSVDASIIDHRHHSRFVKCLFADRRAGLEQNPAVRFFTTNYDTLLEDALARGHVGCVDGFSGGATGFWDPRNIEARLQQAAQLSRNTATISKLHGSIDWVADGQGVVMRVRSAAISADNEGQTLLIYPQATKYQVTQRDPFATLFGEFRAALLSQAPTVLIICGYSFGDAHINEEIERAMRIGPTTLTVLALCLQSTNSDGTLTRSEGLPTVLVEWLQDSHVGERVIVAGSHGYYRGSLKSKVRTDRRYEWWTFSGVCDLLSRGTEAIA